MTTAEIMALMRKTKTAGALAGGLSKANRFLGSVGEGAAKHLEMSGVKNPLVLGTARQSGRLAAAAGGYGAYESDTGRKVRAKIDDFRMRRLQKKQEELFRSRQLRAMQDRVRQMGG